MNMFDSIPLETLLKDVRQRAKQASGVEGAVLGAGLGVLSTMAAVRAHSGKLTAPVLLAGAALGIAYGVADKRLIQDE